MRKVARYPRVSVWVKVLPVTVVNLLLGWRSKGGRYFDLTQGHAILFFNLKTHQVRPVADVT